MKVEEEHQERPNVRITVTWEECGDLYATIDGEEYPQLMKLKKLLFAMLHG